MLLFMSLAILVFNFYPLTAVMIVMLALLNDGAILSIAYDNVKYRKKPEAWNMRVVLGIATVLGITGVVPVFLLFFLARRHANHRDADCGLWPFHDALRVGMGCLRMGICSHLGPIQ